MEVLSTVTGVLEEVVEQSAPFRFFRDNCTFHSSVAEIGAHLLNWTNRLLDKGW